MKRIAKFLIVFLSVYLCSCSKNDNPTPDKLSSNSANLNLGFEVRSADNSQLPDSWYVGIGGQVPVGGESFQCSLDDLEKHSGKLSLKMEIDNNLPDGEFGVFTNQQPLLIKDFAGKTVEYRGWIKTQGVINGNPGLWFNVYDSNNNSLDFGDTYGRVLNGDNNWTQVSVTIDVSKDAVYIAFGGVLAGKGIAWFDDLELYVNGTKY